jgi:hypothetical protein
MRSLISATPCPLVGSTAIHDTGGGNSHEQKSSVVKVVRTSPPLAPTEIIAGSSLQLHVAGACEITACSPPRTTSHARADVERFSSTVNAISAGPCAASG